jgi:hypothetical protein
LVLPTNVWTIIVDVTEIIINEAYAARRTVDYDLIRFLEDPIPPSASRRYAVLDMPLGEIPLEVEDLRIRLSRSYWHVALELVCQNPITVRLLEPHIELVG